MSVKFDFPKLKNESNYQNWAIRAEAFLVSQGYITTLDDIQKKPSDAQEDVVDLLSTQGSNVDAHASLTYIPVIPESDVKRTLDAKGLALIKLIVEDGPLMHISRAKYLGEAWITLKSIYDKEGFLSLFILIKQFIGLLCKKHKINEYLNGICNVINYLEAKEVKLPTPFVLAWVLERLDKLYNNFKTAIYSNFYNN